MQYLVTRVFPILSLLLLASCATVEEVGEQATIPATGARCQLTEAELGAVRVRALDYLIEKWPVLDKRCEQISETVEVLPNSDCSIMGGPAVDGSCELASHQGYRIVFDENTFEPKSIYWLSY